MVVVLLLMLFLVVKYKRAKQDNAKRAHISAFALALYTMMFPVLVTQAVRYGFCSRMCFVWWRLQSDRGPLHTRRCVGWIGLQT